MDPKVPAVFCTILQQWEKYSQYVLTCTLCRKEVHTDRSLSVWQMHTYAGVENLLHVNSNLVIHRVQRKPPQDTMRWVDAKYHPKYWSKQQSGISAFLKHNWLQVCHSLFMKKMTVCDYMCPGIAGIYTDHPNTAVSTSSLSFTPKERFTAHGFDSGGNTHAFYSHILDSNLR